MTIKDALNWGIKKLDETKISASHLDGEVLLSYALKKWSRFSHHNFQDIKILIYREPNLNLPEFIFKKYQNFIKRRQAYEPVAYITGCKEFFGLDFFVTKNVLIPRPETEFLVEHIIKDINKNLNPQSSKLLLMDIGTGSGCIAISLAKQLEQLQHLKHFTIYATDISKDALKIAKINAKNHNIKNKITFIYGNLLEPLKSLPQNSRLNIIVANLPYINRKEIKNLQKDIKKFEPKIAYDGKTNGLFYYEKLLSLGKNYLNKNGKIFLEIDSNQKEKIKNLVKKNFYPKVEIFKEYAGTTAVAKLEI